MHSPFLQTLTGQASSYTPIWLMRQAGRYLPEYRKVREKAGSFLSLCKNPDLATEVTLQPLRRFPLDAAILFSDILVVPAAMGLHLYFSEGEGPKFLNPITSSLDVDNLNLIDANHDLGYVMQTIRNLKQELPATTPLIGFSGSPWTLACYMLEGGASKDYQKAKAWVYRHPALLHQLLSKISIAVSDYLIGQIDAGVDTLMLFDSWGGVLTEAAFQEFSHSYLEQVLTRVASLRPQRKLPTIVFTKGGGMWLPLLDQLPCSALGIDWSSSLASARLATSKVLQGNLDPVILSVADKNSLKLEVERVLNSYQTANQGSYAGHIFNLGHGILPSANPDLVAYLVDLVHELTQR